MHNKSYPSSYNFERGLKANTRTDWVRAKYVYEILLQSLSCPSRFQISEFLVSVEKIPGRYSAGRLNVAPDGLGLGIITKLVTRIVQTALWLGKVVIRVGVYLTSRRTYVNHHRTSNSTCWGCCVTWDGGDPVPPIGTASGTSGPRMPRRDSYSPPSDPCRRRALAATIVAQRCCPPRF